MKNLAIVLILCSMSYALQAPYLYTADSVADTAIQLTWRNNSTAYQGIIILRATSAAAQYGAVDTASGSATSFTDIVKPSSQTTYYYALTAYSPTEHADTSNQDSAKITPLPFESTFVAPTFFVVFWDTLYHAASIGFRDTSNSAIGFRIFRSTNFGLFEMIKDLPLSAQDAKGDVGYKDSTVSSNIWYMYYVVAYKGQQTLNSVTDTVFTFDVNAMKRGAPRKCVISDKIGSFPINYGNWSIKFGDTIVLNETNAPESSYSIIDVSNPRNPRFAGTGKSGSGNSSPSTFNWACIHIY